jgi:hypothetical protein
VLDREHEGDQYPGYQPTHQHPCHQTDRHRSHCRAGRFIVGDEAPPQDKGEHGRDGQQTDQQEGDDREQDGAGASACYASSLSLSR